MPDPGTWRPGGADDRPTFSEAEIRAALAPHIPDEEAAREAAAVAEMQEDAAVTGAALSDEMLAMLAASAEDVARRVEAYRESLWQERRQAWLRRERRGAADDAGLEMQWARYREDAEAEWQNLLARVRLAVERSELRSEGVEGGLVQLGLSRPRTQEPGPGSPQDGGP